MNVESVSAISGMRNVLLQNAGNQRLLGLSCRASKSVDDKRMFTLLSLMAVAMALQLY